MSESLSNVGHYTWRLPELFEPVESRRKVGQRSTGHHGARLQVVLDGRQLFLI
jgi:hypothetical protein